MYLYALYKHEYCKTQCVKLGLKIGYCIVFFEQIQTNLFWKAVNLYINT